MADLKLIAVRKYASDHVQGVPAHLSQVRG